MGHHWYVINIDKRQRLGTSVGPDQPLFSQDPHSLAGLLIDSDPNNHSRSWAGDRIICLSNYAGEYLKGGPLPNEVEGYERWDGVRGQSCDTYGDSWVLRNLSKREYVRSSVLAVKSQWSQWYRFFTRRRPWFGEALIARISWTSDHVSYKPRWPGQRAITRGVWTGDRFDIVERLDFLQRDGLWKDVSEEVAKEIFDIWAGQWGPEYGSKQRDRAAHSPKIDHPFPPLPFEMVAYILGIAAEEDNMAALTLVRLSKAIQRSITPILYCNIILHEDRVESFRSTLNSSRGRDLGERVRRLYIPVATKEVLRACPNLERLLIASFVTNAEDDLKVPAEWPAPGYIMFVLGTSPQLPSKGHRLLYMVTHLCINYVDLGTISTLGPEGLPHLMNLGVHCSFEHNKDHSTLIKRTLVLFPDLKSVLLLSYRQELPTSLAGNTWVELAKVGDERLFARPGLDVQDYDAFMKTGKTIWDDVRTLYMDWRGSCGHFIRYERFMGSIGIFPAPVHSG